MLLVAQDITPQDKLSILHLTYTFLIGMIFLIGFTHNGKFEKTHKFLENIGDIRKLYARAQVESIAKQGVSALAAATPKKTGKTASSWDYEIDETPGKMTISWTNDNVVNGVNVAIILQYGHATNGGGYVAGRDYVNPAIRSVLDSMADRMWKVVVSS